MTEENDNLNIDAVPDPFDPASLRLDQNFTESAGVKRVLTTLPCRKPNRHEFVRVRPGVDWSLETATFEDKINRDAYLVAKPIWPELMGELFPVCLYLTTNRQGDCFLWPVKLPGTDGRDNVWNVSAREAAKLAQTAWIRMAANMTAGMYDTYEAAGELPEPEWPELEFKQLLELCFRGRYITDADHVVIRQLRGEV